MKGQKKDRHIVDSAKSGPAGAACGEDAAGKRAPEGPETGREAAPAAEARRAALPCSAPGCTASRTCAQQKKEALPKKSPCLS
ncbi:MAG: hypothetical protein IKL01_05410, partial [Mailhella sp.]|nr:hypothetical protein [Mailhella sp.]